MGTFTLHIADFDMGGVISYDTQNGTFLKILAKTITGIGIATSGLAMAFLLLTAAIFAEWRRIYKNQLLLQLMMSKYFFTLVRFFYDLRISFVEEIPSTPVYYDFFLRFYTEMVLVGWMFVFSKSMHNSLVKVFTVDKTPLWKVSLGAWGIPIILSAILYAAFVFQSNNEAQIYAIYLVLVKWPVLVANGILLILCIKSILKTNKSKTESNMRIVIIMVALVFTFCFQQVIVDVYKVIMIFMFYQFETMPYFIDAAVITLNILALHYCAFSITFWLFGNEHTRKLWKFEKKIHSQNSVNSRSVGTK